MAERGRRSQIRSSEGETSFIFANAMLRSAMEFPRIGGKTRWLAVDTSHSRGPASALHSGGASSGMMSIFVLLFPRKRESSASARAAKSDSRLRGHDMSRDSLNPTDPRD
jgi:hypothetical protein